MMTEFLMKLDSELGIAADGLIECASVVLRMRAALACGNESSFTAESCVLESRMRDVERAFVEAHRLSAAHVQARAMLQRLAIPSGGLPN
jgi:hypothetical protein